MFKTNPESTSHSDDVIAQNMNAVLSIKDITGLRIYDSTIPVGLIDYDPDKNYRKFIDGAYIEELGEGLQSSGQLQPIALIASATSSALDEAHRSGSLYDLLSKEEVNIIYGNCRYLSITKHTNIEHVQAFVYPTEAEPFVRLIQLIENVDREDPAIEDTAIGIYKEIMSRFSGKVSEFSRSMGKNDKRIYDYFKIGEAALSNELYMNFLNTGTSTDIHSLSSIAKASLEEMTPARKKKIEGFIDEATKLNGDIKGLRKKANELKEFALGKRKKVPSVKEGVVDQKKRSDSPVSEKLTGVALQKKIDSLKKAVIASVSDEGKKTIIVSQITEIERVLRD
jgi:ParB-like chromosome segregation protein Spo0J